MDYDGCGGVYYGGDPVVLWEAWKKPEISYGKTVKMLRQNRFGKTESFNFTNKVKKVKMGI